MSKNRRLGMGIGTTGLVLLGLVVAQGMMGSPSASGGYGPEYG